MPDISLLGVVISFLILALFAVVGCWTQFREQQSKRERHVGDLNVVSIVAAGLVYSGFGTIVAALSILLLHAVGLPTLIR